jgi:hypothetical protein
MLYSRDDLPLMPGLNGWVDIYTTIDTVSIKNDAIALERLRKCAHAVQSIMQCRGWHIKAFHELPSDSPDRGVLVTRTVTSSNGIANIARTDYDLSVQVRYGKHHDRLISLEEVQMVVCHELAYIEHGDHLMGFFRLNRKVVGELNEDFRSGKVVGWKAAQIPVVGVPEGSAWFGGDVCGGLGEVFVAEA